MNLKVKELRLYLKNRSFSIDTIKEKHELVRKIQSLEGVHEPESETHAHSYSNTRHTTFQETVSLDSNSSTPDQESVNVDSGVNNDQNFTTGPGPVPPPTYTDTQNSFPTAAEYQSTSASTSASTVPESRNTPQDATSQSSTASTPRKDELLKLSEISSIDEVKGFSVRQLKYLLKDSLVDYKGILEKSELRKRALNLYNDHQQNQQSIGETEVPSTASTSKPSDENFCKICWENPVDCVFLECAHMVTCIVCSKAIRECPICREHIVRAVRVFKS